MVWMYQGKTTFITGSVPPDDNTTQDDHYRSTGSSSDNKSTENTTTHEMSSLRKKEVPIANLLVPSLAGLKFVSIYLQLGKYSLVG